MDMHSTSQGFFLVPASDASSTTCNFSKKENCFGIVLHVSNILFHMVSVYQVGILLFPADVFNRQILSAGLCTDTIQNRAISNLPELLLIQSPGHELPKYDKWISSIVSKNIIGENPWVGNCQVLRGCLFDCFRFYTKRIKSNFNPLDAWMVNSLWSFLPIIDFFAQYFVLHLSNFPPVVTQQILFLWKSSVV